MTTKKKTSLLLQLKQQIKDDRYKVEIDPYALLSLEDTETFAKIENSGIITIEDGVTYLSLKKTGGITIGEEMEIASTSNESQRKLMLFFSKIYGKIEDKKKAIRNDEGLENEEKLDQLKEQDEIIKKIENIMDDQSLWKHLTEPDIKELIDLIEEMNISKNQDQRIITFVLRRYISEWSQQDTLNLPRSLFDVFIDFANKEQRGWKAETEKKSDLITTTVEDS